MSDGLDSKVASGSASLDSFSCNYNAKGLAALSSRRVASISHLDRFETAAFSIRLLFADDIEAGGGFTVAYQRHLYRSHEERGRPHTGVIDDIPEKTRIPKCDELEFLGRINIRLKVDYRYILNAKPLCLGRDEMDNRGRYIEGEPVKQTT